MVKPSFSILIPAAGASERLGQPKQLVEYQGKTLVQRAVEIAESVSPVEIFVITGAEAIAVKQAIQLPAVRFIHNSCWFAGLGGSIAQGAAACSTESTGLMILLCDQWQVTRGNLQTLAGTWRSNPDRIVAAEANGVLMPPVIFPASCFSQLRKLEGSQGAQSLFKSHPDLVMPVPMANALFDLDTPAQLNQLRNHSPLRS